MGKYPKAGPRTTTVIIKHQENRYGEPTGRIIETDFPVVGHAGWRRTKEFELDLYDMGLTFIPDISKLL